MAICKLTVCTNADGVKNKIVRMGKIEEKEGRVRLSYREENAEVCLLVSGNRAEIRREGDYSLFLPLLEGATTQGGLGLGGSQGQVSVTCRRVECTRVEETTKISLKYALLFGEDSQKMQLEITATERKSK